MASGLSRIDWTAPWLAPWRATGERMAQQVAQGQTVAEACNGALATLRALAQQASPAKAICHVQFVSQDNLPEGMAYEQFIFEQHAVPTREGLHDFFNALCWLHFPLAKQQLNQLQAAAIQSQGVGAVRGPVRDAVTVFDENACLLQVEDVIWDALERRDWQAAFVTHRGLWGSAQMQIFGHAALEKLVAPYKAITVHMWRVPNGLAVLDWDAWLSQDLQADKLARKPFLPTPVLGLPGWWPENMAPDFYQDAQVFRLPRTA
ncbi:MAG: DUF3025 domain-containing protein [Limnohabitans sp.]|nr:DUF3025 domain-containing protein [Limnohabitans sp.]